MKANAIQKEIEDFYYWDMKVLSLDCNYFGDELILMHESDDEYNVVHRYKRCYDVRISHVVAYKKEMPSKNLEIRQIPYYMQDVEISDIVEEDQELYLCKINMHPIELSIKFGDFEIEKFPRLNP